MRALIALLILAMPGAVWAGPGDIGGGGSVVRCSPSDPWVLLDRANQNPQLLKSATPPPAPSGEAATADLQPMDVRSLPAFARASEILDRWSSNSPELVKMIREAMVKATYFRTSGRFTIVPQFTMNPALRRLCPRLEQETGIHFLPKFGSIISDPLWREIDLDTQAGLLIHEALRQIQMAYIFKTANGDLEWITGQLIDGDPKSSPPLQEQPQVNGMFRRLLEGQKTLRILQGSQHQQDRKCESSGNTCPLTREAGELLSLQLVLPFADEINEVLASNQAQRSAQDPKAAWKYLLEQKLIRPEAQH